MNAHSHPWEFRPRGDAAAPALAIGGVEVCGPIAILTTERPAPSSWDAQEQRLFADALAALADRPATRAIILTGPQLFEESSEGDPRGFRLVLDAVAECPRPVIAAIAGDAIGTGLELALACAARVAAPGSRFALPGISTGRLPTHGAVERLPRLIGMAVAAEMVALGQALNAGEAAACGLVDALDGADLLGAARDLASREGRRPPCRGEALEDAIAALFSLRLRLRRQGQAVALTAIQALETAARLPLRRAMAETARLADALAETCQAQALAYAEAGAKALSSCVGIEALGRQLRWPLLREAIHLLDEGATPGQIDRCLMAFGFAEGPFAESDRLGLGAVFLGAPDLAGPGPWLSYSPTLDLMLDAGRLGGDTPGWYRQGDCDAGPRVFDPVVAQLLQGSATFQRLCRQTIPDEGVAERLLLAAINGAAEVLQERVDLGPRLVDAVWTTRLGFPAWRGGLLRHADELGLEKIVDGLNALMARRTTAGAPCELIRRRAQRGEGFA